VFRSKKKDIVEDDNSFIHRIRHTIEDHSATTTGIKVFEHGDETTLDDHERQILAKLRAAHEEWHANNPEPTENSQDDAYKSVKVRI
jgi:hypothetical protein